MEDAPTRPELMVVSAGKEPGTHALRTIRELSAGEYEELTKAKRLIHGFVDDYQQFTMVRNSHTAYRRLLNHYGQQYSSGPPWNEVIAGFIRHEVNRQLRGFFTEFRTFLDYAETSLKKNYEKSSDEAGRFKEARHKEFNSSFAYRFIYALRNYGQHVNLPLRNMRLKSGEFGTETEQTHYLTFEVNRDALLNSGFDWRDDVKATLEQLPERFILDPFIEEAMEALERIHVALVAIKTPEAKRGAYYIGNVAGPLKYLGAACIALRSPTEDSKVPGITLTQDWIPVEIAETIAKLPGPSTLLQWPRLEINFVHYNR